MNNEYIIINKSLLEKRMGELIKESNSGKILSSINSQMAESLIRFKEEILSQSTPLIPELQKTWNAAYIDAMSIDEETYEPLFFQDYISNLKLDI